MPQIAQQDYIRIDTGIYGIDEIKSHPEQIVDQVNNLYHRGVLYDAILADDTASSRIVGYVLEEYETESGVWKKRVTGIYYVLDGAIDHVYFSYE